jgi:hypothetical protein
MRYSSGLRFGWKKGINRWTGVFGVAELVLPAPELLARIFGSLADFLSFGRRIASST